MADNPPSLKGGVHHFSSEYSLAFSCVEGGYNKLIQNSSELYSAFALLLVKRYGANWIIVAFVIRHSWKHLPSLIVLWSII
jgi:hypothetical protein